MPAPARRTQHNGVTDDDDDDDDRTIPGDPFERLRVVWSIRKVSNLPFRCTRTKVEFRYATFWMSGERSGQSYFGVPSPRPVALHPAHLNFKYV